MDWSEAVKKIFRKDAEIINYAVDLDVEEQKATHVNVSVDQLIRFWDTAFESGHDKGYEDGYYEGL